MLSEEEKKVIEEINKSYDDNTGYYEASGKNWITVNKLINKLQKENEKKDKQINFMAKKINEAYINENSFWTWFEKNFGIKSENDYSKEIKEYFERGENNERNWYRKRYSNIEKHNKK